MISSKNSWRLHKHADYQRVYKRAQKQFSSRMTYFAVDRDVIVQQSAGETMSGVAAVQQAGSRVGPRIGLTAGKVLGKAVERNRIKRRMRAAVRASLPLLSSSVDLVLHPKQSVLDADYPALLREVESIFRKVEIRAGRLGTAPRCDA